jgi:hypothetical protein
MTGRVTKLIDDQQRGTIAADDGIDYAFSAGSLVAVTFGSLHVGAAVDFTPIAATRRAETVRLAVAKKTVQS